MCVAAESGNAMGLDVPVAVPQSCGKLVSSVPPGTVVEISCVAGTPLASARLVALRFPWTGLMAVAPRGPPKDAANLALACTASGCVCAMALALGTLSCVSGFPRTALDESAGDKSPFQGSPAKVGDKFVDPLSPALPPSRTACPRVEIADSGDTGIVFAGAAGCSESEVFVPPDIGVLALADLPSPPKGLGVGTIAARVPLTAVWGAGSGANGNPGTAANIGIPGAVGWVIVTFKLGERLTGWTSGTPLGCGSGFSGPTPAECGLPKFAVITSAPSVL